jgi:hypothetical protein
VHPGETASQSQRPRGGKLSKGTKIPVWTRELSLPPGCLQTLHIRHCNTPNPRLVLVHYVVGQCSNILQDSLLQRWVGLWYDYEYSCKIVADIRPTPDRPTDRFIYVPMVSCSPLSGLAEHSCLRERCSRPLDGGRGSLQPAKSVGKVTSRLEPPGALKPETRNSAEKQRPQARRRRRGPELPGSCERAASPPPAPAAGRRPRHPSLLIEGPTSEGLRQA